MINCGKQKIREHLKAYGIFRPQSGLPLRDPTFFTRVLSDMRSHLNDSFRTYKLAKQASFLLENEGHAAVFIFCSWDYMCMRFHRFPTYLSLFYNEKCITHLDMLIFFHNHHFHAVNLQLISTSAS